MTNHPEWAWSLVSSDVRLLVFAGLVTVTVLEFRFQYGYSLVIKCLAATVL